MDETIAISSPMEVTRCIHIGLLCAQDHAVDRPNMSDVVQMLNGESDLHQPRQPAFTFQIEMPNRAIPSKQEGVWSVNTVTTTMVEGRWRLSFFTFLFLFQQTILLLFYKIIVFVQFKDGFSPLYIKGWMNCSTFTWILGCKSGAWDSWNCWYSEGDVTSNHLQVSSQLRYVDFYVMAFQMKDVIIKARLKFPRNNIPASILKPYFIFNLLKEKMGSSQGIWQSPTKRILSPFKRPQLRVAWFNVSQSGDGKIGPHHKMSWP